MLLDPAAALCLANSFLPGAVFFWICKKICILKLNLYSYKYAALKVLYRLCIDVSHDPK